MVDTHCHLNFADHFPDVSSTLARARENLVDRVIVVGCDTESSRIAVALADRHEAVYACVGWHPTNAAKYTSAELAAIEELARHPKSVAIGEIGLDYHWDYSTPDEQRLATTDHLALAAELDMPVVFHCREAYKDLLDWIERLDARRCAMVLHCFGGTTEDAARGVALGCHFGVDGPITYKNADDLRATIATIPIDRLLLETDAPYLTPHPYRGKPNEPAMIPLINSRLAELFAVTPAQMAAQTTLNAETVFWVK
ncbi:MAG: TatD family hydrolase [Armatimonadetes bacterium]|nr:TatD family hydrolase [Armatimonadota bacterium]